MNLLLLCELTNSSGELIRALGHQSRGPIRVGVINQCDCKMLGICDHNVRVLDFGHHAVVGHLALAAPNLGLNFRATLGVLHLIFNLLLAHLQALVDLVALQGYINKCNKKQTQTHPKASINDQCTRLLDSQSELHLIDIGKLLQVIGHRQIQNSGNDCEFSNRLDQLNPSSQAKHTGQAV